MPLADGDALRPADRDRDARATRPTTSRSSPARALFSGDAVLGRGSVFVFPDPGALRGYLAALDRLLELPLDAHLPGPRAARRRAAGR